MARIMINGIIYNGGQSSGGGEETETEQPEEMNEDTEVDPPPQPARFYHKPEDYLKHCKFPRRCKPNPVVSTLEGILNDLELDWFKKSQFKHIFHMPKERKNHSLSIWLLLLRTAKLNKMNEWWFVVNGVPIRYSLKEHALLSGLNCKTYPENEENLGSFDFVIQHFGRKDKIGTDEVEEMLKKMEASEDRMRMAALYFLGSIFKLKAKFGSHIDEFILRIVGDLEVCQSYPWGRCSFEDCSDDIGRNLANLNGIVKDQNSLTFGSFITPLELLAFEAVDVLKIKYREDVISSHDCPRMCKGKFKKIGRTGHTIKMLSKTLGETKEIRSLLQPSSIHEEQLLSCIWDDNYPQDTSDEVAEAMTSHLNVGKSIFWQNLYQMDVSSREAPAPPADTPPPVVPPPSEHVPPSADMFREFREMKERLEVVEARMKEMEENAKEKERVVDDHEVDDHGYMGGDDYTRHSPVQHFPDNPSSFHPPTDQSPVQPFADQFPVDPPADQSPVQPPTEPLADQSLVQPPADQSPVKPLADQSPVQPSSDQSPVEPLADQSSVEPLADQSLVQHPADQSPIQPLANQSLVVTSPDPPLFQFPYNEVHQGPVQGPLPEGSTTPLVAIGTRYKIGVKMGVRKRVKPWRLKSPFTEGKKKVKKG